ncbi:NUDIX hydrolase [bacterium]|nr:NUDIX hydrolase [bacterium]
MLKTGEKEVFNAGIFRIADITLLNDKKEEIHHSAVRFVKTVCVLPITSDGKIWLERQYRSPIDKTVIEIPAGKMDPGEIPEETMKREIEEEMGLRVISFEERFQAFVTCGYSDEYMHYFTAIVEKIPKGERKYFEDPDEEITLFSVTKSEAKELVKSGEIEDAKTIMMLLDHFAK